MPTFSPPMDQSLPFSLAARSSVWKISPASAMSCECFLA